MRRRTSEPQSTTKRQLHYTELTAGDGSRLFLWEASLHANSIGKASTSVVNWRNIAITFIDQRSKRVFVWSTGKELGLVGAAAYARNGGNGKTPKCVFALDTFVSLDSRLNRSASATALSARVS